MSMIYNGITDNATFFARDLTFDRDGGKVCKIVDYDTIGLCEASNRFHGVIRTIERGGRYCVMQQKGYVTVSYSGNMPPPVGDCYLVADGVGGVRYEMLPKIESMGMPREYLVVQVDEERRLVTIFLG